MSFRLAIVELRVKDWVAAVAWFRKHFQLITKLEQPTQQYALLETGSIQLAIKADQQVHPSTQVQLQWEVDDLVATEQELRASGAMVTKPIKVSEEGYRRIIIDGPEGIQLLLFDWIKLSDKSSSA